MDASKLITQNVPKILDFEHYSYPPYLSTIYIEKEQQLYQECFVFLQKFRIDRAHFPININRLVELANYIKEGETCSFEFTIDLMFDLSIFLKNHQFLRSILIVFFYSKKVIYYHKFTKACTNCLTSFSRIGSGRIRSLVTFGTRGSQARISADLSVTR